MAHLGDVVRIIDKGPHRLPLARAVRAFHVGEHVGDPLRIFRPFRHPVAVRQQRPYLPGLLLADLGAGRRAEQRRRQRHQQRRHQRQGLSDGRSSVHGLLLKVRVNKMMKAGPGKRPHMAVDQGAVAADQHGGGQTAAAQGPGQIAVRVQYHVIQTQPLFQ